MRDFLALGVAKDGHLEYSAVPPCALPRAGCLLLAFGPIRTVVRRDAAFILGAEDAAVTSMATAIAEALSAAQLEDGPLPSELGLLPFELRFLEIALHEVSGAWQRQLQLLTALSRLALLGVREATPNEVADRLGALQPLLEELGRLEAQFRELDHCIAGLLSSDDDMSAMILTVPTFGREADDHDDVELILEATHRHVRQALLHMDALAKQLRFGRELSEVKLAVHRGQLIRVNVQVGILGAALAFCAFIASLFGMNVPVLWQKVPQHSRALQPAALPSPGPSMLVYGESPGARDLVHRNADASMQHWPGSA